MDFLSLAECTDFIKQQPREKIPELMQYAVYYFDLNEEEKDALYRMLRREDETSDDNILTNDFFAKYEHARAIGMNAIDAGRYCGIVPERMKRILSGERVKSASLYQRLCDIEVRAPVVRRYKALETVDVHLNKNSFAAAQKVLENTDEEWRNKEQAQVMVHTVSMSSEACKDMSKKAMEHLREIRRQRLQKDEERF